MAAPLKAAAEKCERKGEAAILPLWRKDGRANEKGAYLLGGGWALFVSAAWTGRGDRGQGTGSTTGPPHFPDIPAIDPVMKATSQPA